MTFPQNLRAAALRLGDVVKLFDDGPWSFAIVKRLAKKGVTLFRPFGISTDCSENEVGCYVGVEEFTVTRDGHLMEVWDRKETQP